MIKLLKTEKMGLLDGNFFIRSFFSDAIMSGEKQFVPRTCCYIHAIAWWKLELTDICKERTPQQR